MSVNKITDINAYNVNNYNFVSCIFYILELQSTHPLHYQPYSNIYRECSSFHKFRRKNIERNDRNNSDSYELAFFSSFRSL